MSGNAKLWARLGRACQRRAAQWACRRMVSIHPDVPLISFTFDDFPRSALLEGGEILRKHGCAGTYYTSFGLLGRMEPTGQMFLRQDVEKLATDGHELACHTYDHCDSWDTAPGEFEASIVRNQRAAAELIPGVTMNGLSYPISYPRPGTKRRVARHFDCARGGGQTFNIGRLDANYLKAFFLEQSRDDFELVRRTIQENATSRGWLIFATHDVSDAPTRFGCTPSFFERVLECALETGATVLPLREAWNRVRLPADRCHRR